VLARQVTLSLSRHGLAGVFWSVSRPGKREREIARMAIYLIPATALISASGAKQWAGLPSAPRVVLPAADQRMDGWTL